MAGGKDETRCRNRKTQSREICSKNAPRGPNTERHRPDHQQDTDQRCARSVIGFPNVDASGGNAYADDDEAESHEYVCERGFHKVSLLDVERATVKGLELYFIFIMQ
jgi:hypothetical protein